MPLEDHIFDVKTMGNFNDSKVAVPLIDLSKFTFTNPDNDEEEVTIGGRVISMDWDPSGRYLAIIFQVCLIGKEYNFILNNRIIILLL